MPCVTNEETSNIQHPTSNSRQTLVRVERIYWMFSVGCPLAINRSWPLDVFRFPFGPMSTEILPTHTPALFAAAVKRAAELLRAGKVVALPTETVYGLAANALDEKAVARIFQIKGRPANNPIIVHIASVEMAKRCVTGWPAGADQLAKAFWPGPLTLILPRAKEIPGIVTAGGADGGGALAQPSVHPGGDSRMQFPARRAQRESVQPRFPDQRRARAPAVGRQNFPDCGRRAVTSRHRVHRARLDGVAATSFAAGNDLPRNTRGGVGQPPTSNLQPPTSKFEKSGFAVETLFAEGEIVRLELA